MWYLPATVQVSSEPLEVNDPSTTLIDQSSHCSGTAIFALISGHSLCGNLPSLQEHRMGRGGLVCKPVLLAVWHVVFTASLVSQPLETLHHFDRTESGGVGEVLEGCGVASSSAAWHIVFIYYISGVTATGNPPSL